MKDEDKVRLAQIINDKYSVGAFSGMIFNAKVAHPEIPIEQLLQLALDVKKEMERLAK